jgi:PAS domain S-box-containing protein
VLSRKPSLALGAALLLIVTAGAVSYQWIDSAIKSSRWADRSDKVVATADDLLLVIKRMDSSTRGFALTGNDFYLRTYPELRATLARDQAALRVLTIDDARQQQRLAEVERLCRERLAFADRVIAVRRRDGLAAAAALYGSDAERRGSESIRSIGAAFQAEEFRLLDARNAEARRKWIATRTILIIETLIGLAIAAIAVGLAYRGSMARSAAEQSLRNSEEKYRLLLDGVQDHAIFMIDPDGQIISWSAGAERINGYSAAEIIGRNRSCFFTAEDTRNGRPAEVLRIAADTGRYQAVGTRLRKDGSQFLADVTVAALRNRAGELLGYSEFSSDLSEGTESEARYRGLLEAAPDAMVVVNQKGEIVLLNVQAETQFGYRRAELVGQEVTNIIPEGFAERLIADALRTAEDALAQQIGTGIELYGRRKDGTVFPIEIMLSPLKSADGILVTAAIRNIATRKQAEAQLIEKVEELNRSNEELAQFANLASHDLQEPLRMVASYTQLLSKRYSGKLDSDADEFIAFAVDGANRMQRLIQGLLAYSRVGTKGKELLRISSEDALAQALLNVGGAMHDSGALVTHDLLPSVLADEIQLIQLFQNLVSNAIKYQPAGVPRIHISAARADKQKWLFSVADNGLGIEAQYFEKIFGMFQRLHKREEYEGTGIGLAICKKIVERHGGTLSVESRIGVGSTFRFALTGSESTLTV